MTGAFTSTPRSNRADASVLRASRLLVRLTDEGLKYALSNATARVAPETSDAAQPMTPAIACVRAGVGNHQHVGVERPLHAVERRRDLAGARATDPQLVPGERRQIEGMHRVAELQQDVVGDVDEGADRAHGGRLQTARHPRG